MKIRWVGFAIFFLLCANPVGAGIYNHQEFLMKAGDNPQWSSSDLDDRSWSKVHFMDVPQLPDIVWLRIRISLDHPGSGRDTPFGVFIALMAAHELYWDGILIGKSGQPGRTPSQEIPGQIQTLHLVPERLATPGTHVVAIRTSAHHRHFYPVVGYWTFLTGDYAELLRIENRDSWISLTCLSGMLLVALFSFALFLTDRSDRSYLVLSMLAFVSAVLLVAETWRNLIGYTYNYHLLRLIIITSLTALWSLILLVFMIVRFPVGRSSIFVVIAVVTSGLSLLVPGWDNKNLFIFCTGIPLSLTWTIRAFLQNRRGSLPAILGLIAAEVFFFWQPFLFSDLTLYFAVDFLLLCLLVAHALQVKQVRMERQEALLKSARLEIELLRKHIQPHFLMNTLTALAEWIDQDPKTAIQMIHSLADEFRILSQVSNRSLIPLKDEIQLCSHHLEIMSRRKGRQYVLSTQGIDPEAMIPPAVIHTLVENAITHNKVSDRRVEFRLSANQEDSHIRFIFEAPLDTPDECREPEGTGLKYVRARLQESFGQDWHMDAGPSGHMWKTEIVIPGKP